MDKGRTMARDASLPSLSEQAHKSMAKWFIHCGINPNTTNLPSFANMMNALNPNFPFRRSQVESQILEIHRESKEKAKRFLKDYNGSRITLSYEWLLLASDWTRDYIKDPILHEDFVSVTAHFIDENWKIQRWVLSFTTPDDVIVSHFRNAVQGFEIQSKVSTLLLPNDHLDFEEETIRKCITNDSVSIVYCCADLFRLMVNDAFKGISSSLLEDVRMLVGWGRFSSTNWNMTLSHLQQVLAMKAEDAFSNDEIYNGYYKPSDEEWIKIETFCKLAGCVYKVAVEVFEGGFSTSNVYFHLLAELKVMLRDELASGENDYFVRKAKKVLTRFDKYWNHMFMVLGAASVLDPRLKMKYVEFYCSKSDDERSKAETVLDYLRSLYARYAASDDSKEEDQCDHEGDCGEGGDYDEEEEQEREGRKEREKRPDACKEFAFFKEFLKLEGYGEKSKESELDSYLKEPVLEWDKNFRALEWWRGESRKYPILARVARDILSIPISRATSYDAYVIDKREPPEFVVSLEPEVANAMMCSRKWLGL